MIPRSELSAYTYLAKGWAEMQAAAEENIVSSGPAGKRQDSHQLYPVIQLLLLRFPPGLQASPGAIRHDDEVGECTPVGLDDVGGLECERRELKGLPECTPAPSEYRSATAYCPVRHNPPVRSTNTTPPRHTHTCSVSMPLSNSVLPGAAYPSRRGCRSTNGPRRILATTTSNTRPEGMPA